MHLVTIMDYTEHRAVLMCKMWLYLAKRFNPHAKVSIFHHHSIPEIRKYASRYTDVSIVHLDFPSNINVFSKGHTHRPAQDLQLALWKKIQQTQMTKFIYLDADAFILSSLNDWWHIIDTQPFIAVAETRLPSGELRLNAGVFSYSNKAGFIAYEKLVKQYRNDGNRILVEAGAQGLLDTYFRKIHYSYIHPLIGHEYNTIAKFCRIHQVDDQEIIIYSGKYPFVKKATRLLQLKKKDFCENWLWWNNPKKVKILHAFGGPGPGFKFWELRECKKLWRYCLKQV